MAELWTLSRPRTQSAIRSPTVARSSVSFTRRAMRVSSSDARCRRSRSATVWRSRATSASSVRDGAASMKTGYRTHTRTEANVTNRGIHAVREHLAKLPPASSLTIEQRRAQYERAERVFPTPADVAIQPVKAPQRPAEWLAPPASRPDTVVLYFHGGGYVIGSPRSHRHWPPRSLARPARGRCCSTTGWRPSTRSRPRSTTRSPPTGGSSGRARARTRRPGRRLGRRRAHRGRADRAARARAPAAGRRRVHLAVGRPHVQRRQLRDQGRRRSDRHPRRRRRAGSGLRGARRPQGAARLAALRRSARSAAAARSGRERRGAARRRARSRARARARPVSTSRSRSGRR